MLRIKADFRIKKKTAATRFLRKQNQCPAIIYQNVQYLSVTIQLNHNDIQHPEVIIHFYKKNIIELIMKNDTTIIVKIQDIQYHPFKSKIIHIDFIRM